ncbi:unnamed protein product [Protopolystoma xenopodis]|uniref:Uncharacterized protein n=1 Tax=Protopolystoma xenopodis TaxID=117903 RepID=A0A448XGU4_9PLAT|nr:unnamed protein product [Protopolystoma xenopodis]
MTSAGPEELASSPVPGSAPSTLLPSPSMALETPAVPVDSSGAWRLQGSLALAIAGPAANGTSPSANPPSYAFSTQPVPEMPLPSPSPSPSSSSLSRSLPELQLQLQPKPQPQRPSTGLWKEIHPSQSSYQLVTSKPVKAATDSSSLDEAARATTTNLMPIARRKPFNGHQLTAVRLVSAQTVEEWFGDFWCRCEAWNNIAELNEPRRVTSKQAYIHVACRSQTDTLVEFELSLCLSSTKHSNHLEITINRLPFLTSRQRGLFREFPICEWTRGLPASPQKPWLVDSVQNASALRPRAQSPNPALAAKTMAWPRSRPDFILGVYALSARSGFHLKLAYKLWPFVWSQAPFVV